MIFVFVDAIGLAIMEWQPCLFFSALPTKYKTVEELEGSVESAGKPSAPKANIQTSRVDRKDHQLPSKPTEPASEMTAFNKLVGMMQVCQVVLPLFDNTMSCLLFVLVRLWYTNMGCLLFVLYEYLRRTENFIPSNTLMSF